MTVADTSIAQFNKLCLDRKITKLDDRVYLAFKYGVIEKRGAVRTRREAAAFLHDEASTIAGAVNRLVRLGKLRVGQFKIKCFITNNKVEALHYVE